MARDLRETTGRLVQSIMYAKIIIINALTLDRCATNAIPLHDWCIRRTRIRGNTVFLFSFCLWETMNDCLPPPPPPLLTVTSFYIIPVRLGGGHTLRPLSSVLFKHNRGTRAAVQCATQFIKHVWYDLHLCKFYYKHYCCYALTGTCLDFCSGNEIIVRVRLLTVTNLRFLACGHVTSLVHGFFKTFCSLRCYPTLY